MPVRYILSSVWVRLSLFSQLSIMQYMGLCVFSLPISLVMIERIYTLSYYHHQIGSMNWYPLFRVHETMVCAVCLSIFFLSVNIDLLSPSFTMYRVRKQYLQLIMFLTSLLFDILPKPVIYLQPLTRLLSKIFHSAFSIVKKIPSHVYIAHGTKGFRRWQLAFCVMYLKVGIRHVCDLPSQLSGASMQTQSSGNG